MRQYLDLLQDILDNGLDKSDRTGTGTRSVFGRQLRWNLSEGFPLLTTKKVSFKNIAVELLWMLSGSTNIRPLVQNGCSIWTDWPLKYYRQTTGIDIDRKTFEQHIITDDMFAIQWGELGPVYGYQWRNWPGKLMYSSIYCGEKGDPIEDEFSKDKLREIRTDGLCAELSHLKQEPIDQISNAIHLLKTNPDSRRIIVNAWNPADIDEMAISGLPPCHMMFQFYTKELTPRQRWKWVSDPHGAWTDQPKEFYENSTHEFLDNRTNAPRRELSCQLYIRSNDMFLGSPYNIASYSLLTHMIAHVCGMAPGEFICTIGDAHIYQNHMDQVKEQLTRTPGKLPWLEIGRIVDIDWHDTIPITDIFDFKLEDIRLRDYKPQGTISAPVAV